MNAIKVCLLFVIFLTVSCSTRDPKTLAREYCACFKEGLNDPNRMNECAELAREHQELLPKDPEAAKIYGEEIIRCAVYDHIRCAVYDQNEKTR